jgi:CheY-like chemotaxis protein
MTTGRILIIDDDLDFVEIYLQLLKRLGLEVTAVPTADDAIAELERSGRDLDVVLLDQKLQGPTGPDSGLELIGRIAILAPFAKTIVVTGYARPDAIERAFGAGIYDYLVKNGAFEALLRAKVRNAIEITRERRQSVVLSREETGLALRQLWDRARSETDRNRKGALLEDLVKLLFRATPGFERVETNLRNASEEIDIVVENRADDLLWKQDGSAYLVGECKNWSSPCDAVEFRNFYMKLTNKFERVRTGFFFAPGGFTAGFHQARAEQKQGDVLIIPVDADDLDRWISADDRHAVLADLHKRAVFAGAK